ncbi:hypothetical protein BH10PLA2_BH10PLA2_20200 [soil metagenome]
MSCEGAHSLIRKQARIDFVGKTYPLAFCMADVELDWAREHNANHVWCHKDGSFAALPLPGHNTWRLFVEVTPQDDCPPDSVTLDVIRKLMAERIGDHTTKISNPTWISEFRIHCRMVDRYRDERVLLAGDTTHIHNPTGARVSLRAFKMRPTSDGSWAASFTALRRLSCMPETGLRTTSPGCQLVSQRRTPRHRR